MREGIHLDKQITQALYKDQSLPGSERIELLDNTGANERRLLGYANIRSYSEPFPFIYVAYLQKNSDYRKEDEEKLSTGDLIIEKVNVYLTEKNLPGILLVEGGNFGKLVAFYERNGWKDLANLGANNYRGYNLPQNLTKEDIIEMQRMIDEDYDRLINQYTNT